MMIQKLLEDNLKGNAIAKKFFYVYLAILSNLFSVIPFIIYRRLSKRKKVEKENKARNDIDYIYIMINQLNYQKDGLNLLL